MLTAAAYAFAGAVMHTNTPSLGRYAGAMLTPNDF